MFCIFFYIVILLGAPRSITNLVAHLRNERRLPGNDVSDPRRGPELVWDFSVNRRSGFWTLKRQRDINDQNILANLSARILNISLDRIYKHFHRNCSYLGRLGLWLLGLLFAFLHGFFFLVALRLFFLLFVLVVFLLLFGTAEPEPRSFPWRQRGWGLQVDPGVSRPVRVLTGCVAVWSKPAPIFTKTKPVKKTTSTFLPASQPRAVAVPFFIIGGIQVTAFQFIVLGKKKLKFESKKRLKNVRNDHKNFFTSYLRMCGWTCGLLPFFTRQLNEFQWTFVSMASLHRGRFFIWIILEDRRNRFNTND